MTPCSSARRKSESESRTSAASEAIFAGSRGIEQAANNNGHWLERKSSENGEAGGKNQSTDS
jgi:hypothetical protein